MQVCATVLGFVTFFSIVYALEIISPTLNQTIDRSSSFKVSWRSVTTDAPSFVLAARRQGDSNPDAVKRLSNPIPTSAGNITLAGSVFPTEGNWTIYALTNDVQRGILAQSQIFEAKGKDKKETGSSKTGLSDEPTKDSDSGKKSSTTDASPSKSDASVLAVSSNIARYALFSAVLSGVTFSSLVF